MDFDKDLTVYMRRPEDVASSESPSRRRLHLGPLWLVSLLVALPVLTYVATVNGWLDWIAGPQFTQAEFDMANTAAEKSGFSQGERVGYDGGYEAGLDVGRKLGEETGFEIGHAAGEQIGFADGYSAGGSEGYEDGYVDGSAESYGIGYQDGCLVLFDLLGTTRIGSWWDYYYSPAYAYYYESGVCY